MQPGATVTALVPRENRIDLFVTGTDGAVWSTWWEPGKPWQNWFLIHPEVKMRPGATVTALVPRKDHIDLFVTGTDGAVWSTWWEPGKPWQELVLDSPGGQDAAGCHRDSVGSADQPHRSVCHRYRWCGVVDVVGTGKAMAELVPHPSRYPDAAARRSQRNCAACTNHIDLFVTGTDGAVWSTWWEPTTGWF